MIGLFLAKIKRFVEFVVPQCIFYLTNIGNDHFFKLHFFAFAPDSHLFLKKINTQKWHFFA